MPFPPDVPTGTRINTTPQVDLHPDDHNEIHAALTAIINELGSNPSGDWVSVTTRFAQECPVGEIKMWAGSSAPSGWGMCDGVAISRSANAELFAVIGTTYGAGDGSTTFNKPNLQSRFPVGKGAAAWSDALGETGGAADAVAVAHVHGQPAHTHPIDMDVGGAHPHDATGGDPAANSGYLNRGAGTGWEALNGNGTITASYTTPAVAANGSAHDHTGTATANGGDSTNSQTPQAAATNANLPPYQVVNFIIRLT